MLESSSVGINIKLLKNCGNFSIVGAQNLHPVVGCPGDTIQFLNYGYVEYIKTVLGFLNIDSSLVDWSKYEYWNPYED